MSAANVIQFPLAPTADASNHAAVHRHVGREFVARPEHASHFVQFYEEEETLFDMVGDFLLPGLRAGDALIVIATGEHREAFTAKLGAAGHDAVHSGQLVLLDARETLAKFMVDGAPDGERFRRVLADTIARSNRRDQSAGIRAYGEMVDILWKDGDPDAAIRLEELWNDAGRAHAFTLFCAYTMGNFYREGDSARFFDICKNHTHVIPTESFSRAQALEREVAQRVELEEALRAALRKRTEVEEQLRESLRREQEARTEAEAGIQFRELFVGMLGHDLRNPLNTMLNTARILVMKGEVAPEGRGRIDRMVTSGVRMQRMIEQILDLTRARLDGGIPVTRTFQDTDPIVAKIVGEVRAAHEGRVIICERHGDCWASVDADRLEQVVSNLVSNAVTHGAGGEPVRVLLTGSALAVHLSVENKGEPIAPELLAHLFDPFSHGETPRRAGGGLGLGLFIAERIVRAHGGSLDVSSSRDAGTIFEATLPKHERVAG